MNDEYVNVEVTEEVELNWFQKTWNKVKKPAGYVAAAVAGAFIATVVANKKNSACDDDLGDLMIEDSTEVTE